MIFACIMRHIPGTTLLPGESRGDGCGKDECSGETRFFKAKLCGGL